MLEIWNTLKTNREIEIVIVGAIVWLAVMLINKSVHKFFARTSFIETRKEETLESMIRSITKYVATIGFIFFVLSLYIDNFERVLAGAGIVGIIVGFGAQSLIKDILSGLFLIYEKQLHKGDFVSVNNTFNGTVEDIGLRFLKVREWSGKLLTISNGEVKQIQNYNIERMRVIEKVVVSYRENPEHVMELLQSVCDHLNNTYTHFLKKDHAGSPIEPYQVYGMTSLNAGYRGYEYTVVGLVDDAVYWTAAKETRRALAQAMYDQQIIMAEEHIRIQQPDENKQRSFS
ncbi:mechanosensitive ion channel family protein [Bacillus sp. HMF5848]|uniref:mechanosensitive ion channel family protein n=1 Tax=Bacillus sp. HMF5848 TaxID=2495421 RepID=UPI000F7935D0|nr:mechanosensitive ion channel family protein [Bacillus sp. HMF5848]RSK26073.1 mechanosensitive ion channel family protein [Bacillus sp. HMF5848]